jgi:hypothetical protein
MKRLFVFALVVSLYTACDDNEADPKPTDPEIIPVAVNYVASDEQISEQAEAHEVVLLLEEPAEADGTIEISISGEAGYGSSFTTGPAATGNKISLAVTKSDTEISFTIFPVNNTKLWGNKSAIFSVVSATGSVTLGESVTYALTLMDDELLNKPESATRNGSGLTQVKNIYEYNEDGLVSKLHWESKTVFGTTVGTDAYFYNEAGGITRISRQAGAMETMYTWEDGVIVKSEQVNNGVVFTYTIYEYDEAGRVKKAGIFTNNGAGEFASDFYTVYSYYEDGNVHQITNYSFDVNEDVFVV